MRRSCIVLAATPTASVELGGIFILERLLRTLQRCGIERPTIISGAAKPDAIVDLAQSRDELFLAVRGDTVIDVRLLRFLLEEQRAIALIDSANFCGAAVLPRDMLANITAEAIPVAGLPKIDIDDLPLYSPELRRNLRPFWFSPAAIAQDRQRVERALIDATQKGAQDFPALLHAPIEKFLVGRLCRTRITPHQLTIAWIILAFAVTMLFATGHFGWGIALAFVIGILDGLDGKLARLRVETSDVGKLEHRFDSFFEVAWPSVIALYLVRSGQLPNAFAYLALLITGQIDDGLAKGAIYDAFAKLNCEPNLFDRVVRLFGGRRNVVIWILLIAVVLGAPAKGFILMAWWQIATAIVDLPHALWLRSRLRMNQEIARR